MTYEAFAPADAVQLVRLGGTRSRSSLSQAILCAAILTIGASVGLWRLYAGPTTDDAPATALATPFGTLPTAMLAETPHPELLAALARKPQAPDRSYADFLAPSLTVAFAPLVPIGSVQLTAPQTAPAAPAPQIAMAPEADTDSQPDVLPNIPVVSSVVQDPPVPLPVPRPARLRIAELEAAPPATRVRRPAAIEPIAVAPATVPASTTPSFFERLFRPSTPSNALAYAAPEDGGIANLVPGRGNGIAVYDIAAHTVYLPDGTRLEAHSGLGGNLDDPRSVGQRMRGATPPNIYDLSLRESLFHGVQALRLTPVGTGETYGRGGLLAHTFMLGPRGDSNGCVVFRNYQAFLRAFESGQIRRLQVVSNLN